MGGKAPLLQEFASQVRAIRQGHVEAHLLVMIDGDDWDDAKILEELNKRLDVEGLHDLDENDRVLVIVPRREMDTWVRHLQGTEVTEDKAGYRKLDDASEARSVASSLAKSCNVGAKLDSPLPSLTVTCEKWQAYRRQHRL